MVEQFNFSKIEDQEKFDKLSQGEKNKHVEQSQEKAELVNELIRKLDNNGKITKEIVKELTKDISYEEFREIQELPEIQRAMFKCLKELASDGKIYLMETTQLSGIGLPYKMLKVPEIRKAMFEGAQKLITNDDVYAIEEIQRTVFELPDEALQPLFFKRIRLLISKREDFELKKTIELIKKIQKSSFKLSDEMLQRAIFEGVKNNLVLYGDLDLVFSLQKSEFKLPNEVFRAPEMEKVIFESIKQLVVRSDIRRVQHYLYLIGKIQKSHFKLSEELLERAIFEGMKSKMSSEWWGVADLINSIEPIQQSEFKLPDEMLHSVEMERVVFESIQGFVLEGQIDSVVKIQKSFLKLTNETLQLFDVQKSVDLKYPQGMNFSELMKLCNINQIGVELVKSLHGLSNFSYPDQIKLLMSAQGDASFLYFESIKEISNFKNLLAEDIEYIVYVGKKYGTQARNILDNILARLGIGLISQEREIIEKYIAEMQVLDFDVYSQYREFKKEGNESEIKNLKERLNSINEKIYKGEADEEIYQDKLYGAVLYYIFPPAQGLTRNQYDSLNKNRPDRRDDVPEILDDLQYQKFTVPTGRYILDKDEELDLEEWAILSKVIKKVNLELKENGEIKIDNVEVGAKIINIYQNKKQNTDEGKRILFEEMYRYHLNQGGGRLEDGYEITIQSLMGYKEFIGDRIKNDLIKECVGAWIKRNPKEYEELKQDTLNRLRQNINKNFAKVKNMLQAIKKQKNERKKERAVQGLDDFLRDFGLSYKMIKNMNLKKMQNELEAVWVEYDGDLTEENYRIQEYYDSEVFKSAYDQFLIKHDKNALVMQKISSDLVANVNKKMRKEMDKFEFHRGGGEAENIEFEFVISKKKEHGVVGYNMGVCVASDEKLWNDSQFMNTIIFNPKLKQAMGGMHFLIRENCLTLPGINPSQDILSQVDAEKLFDEMINYAKKVKDKLGLRKILIVKRSDIHSNRSQINDIIIKKNYSEYDLKRPAKFTSFGGFGYDTFQKCFEVI